VKALDIVRKYKGQRVLLLGEAERLSNPEWMRPKVKEYEPRETECEALTILNGAEVSDKWKKRYYDFVVDAGFLEHQFDISTQLLKTAEAVRVGGVIFHLSPISMVNWGYWNISPKMFKEFYDANGWELLEAFAVKKDHFIDLPLDRASTASEVSMHVVARRTNTKQLRMP